VSTSPSIAEESSATEPVTIQAASLTTTRIAATRD
jgi:hypothetical protein